ncbi:porin family protein [Aridibaculum aurantiacum]|uniref:porin family protein n=1 Tax=Aridibaculum aurantiacum TaxID=2810307 RepID=UPI001A97013C|nr:porin family protein [Aridibaculum aurantiacum]
MKSKILLLLFIAVSSISIAQSPVSFGVRGGVTSYGMQGDAVNNLKDILDFTNGMVATEDRKGFFAGAFANISVGETFSIEPGVYYTQKGYQLRGDFNLKGLEFIGANARARLQSEYLDIPVLVKANLGGFQVFAGPQVSYLLKINFRTTAGVFGFNLFDRKMDATEQFNRLDAGVTGGVAYQFANGLNVSAAYDHGLTRVDNNRNVESYNRGFKVGVGIKF